MGKIKSSFVSVLLTFVVISVGCVKKRPDREGQGQNLGELIPKSAVQTWRHSIYIPKTAKPEFNYVTRAQELRIEPATFKNQKGEELKLNILGTVPFDSKDSIFLKNALPEEKWTFGTPSDPEVTFPIQYEITPYWLIILKRVPVDKVSMAEWPRVYKTDANDALVILGGYKISHYNVEFAKNENGRNTNIKQKWSVTPANHTSAAYFKTEGGYVPFSVKIDPGFEAFKTTNMADFLPASYFTEGEWYYAKALVSTKPGEETHIGHFEGGISTAFEFANKIRFRRHPGYLRGVNVAIAEQKKRVQKKEGQAEDDVIAIPVAWIKMVDLEKNKLDLFAENLELSTDNLSGFTDRTFGIFDFERATTLAPKTINEAIASRVIKDEILEDLHIAQDGFSFTIAKVATGEKTRYAFKRVKKSTYQPLVYRKAENDTFGAFYTAKPYVITSRDDRKGDVESTILINRFHPQKKILFRFSQDTPKLETKSEKPTDKLNIDYREIGRRCVKYWNRAFEVAGTNVKVEIEKDKDGNEIDGEVGDINANIINIIDTLNESGLAGIGPSLADPETGEIVAGAANVYVAAYRSGISDRLRNYIRVKSGLARDFAFSKEIQKERPLMEYTSAEVDHYCPELRDFAISLKGQPQYTSERENPYIDRCLEKLLPRVLSEVTCHEMGHVFGLRHNFECSADKENSYKGYAHLEKVFPKKDFPEVYKEFYPKKEFLPQSSCLMDYMPDTRPMLMVPGLYDIAALAFIYGDKVEKAGTRDASPTGFGQLIPVDRSKPLTEQKAFKDSQKFAFCDDYEAGTFDMLPINPMCMRHDFGNTPIAIMNHYFNAFRDDVVLNFRRWDRASARETGRPWYLLESLTSVYKLWRAHLYDFVGKQNAHLHDITDEDSYQKLKDDLATRFKKTDFIGVNELFARLMSSIVDIPDLYCVAVQGEPGQAKINRNTDVQLINFKMAFDDIIASGASEKVEGCEDPVLANYVAQKYGAKWKVQGEIGYPTDNIQFSRSKDDKWEGMDIVGLKEIRKEAMARLTSALGSDRVYELKIRNNFSPHALDEPFIYNAMRNKVEQRLFDGIDVSGPITEMLEAKGFKVDEQIAMSPVKKFEADWQIYKQAYEQFRLYRKSEAVPEYVKTRADLPYTVEVSRHFEKRKPREAYYYFERDRVYFFASPAAPSAYRVINTLRELEEPVRFDVGYIDSTSQEGLWQMAELVRDLPVKADHKRRFDLVAYLAFSKRMMNLIESPNMDPSIKSSPLWPLFENLQKFSKRIDELTITANASGASDAGQPVGGDHMSPAMARKLLAELQNSESKFLSYFTLHTGGLDRRHLNQVALMEQWMDSRPSMALRADWRNRMLPEIEERLRFMVDEPKEFEEHRMSMLSILVTSLNALSRDPL